MDEVPTLILSNRFTEDSNKMWRSAIDLGWDVERVFNWNLIKHLNPAKPIIYGEPLFNQFVSEQLDVTLDIPWPDFLDHIGEKYTKRRIWYLPATEARKLEGPIFLKPPNNKTFPAKVYNSGLDLPESVKDSDMVIVSEVVDWTTESRFFIFNRKVATYSRYAINGQLDTKPHKSKYPPELWMVQKLLKDDKVFLPNAVVIDCGIIRGKGPAIVEANEVNGSGIYECDPVEVLKVLERSYYYAN